MRGSATTHDGYERQDWVDFRERVLELGEAGDLYSLTRYLKQWMLVHHAYPPLVKQLAEGIAKDMQTIIDSLTPEGSEG